MTRKDYKLLAEVLKNHSLLFFNDMCYRTFVMDLSAQLEQDNPAFDKIKFYEAAAPDYRGDLFKR